MGFDLVVEEKIREAIRAGEFDDLPGAGKPIPGLNEPDDEMWWVKRKLRAEGLSYLPPALAVRREAERGLEEALKATSSTSCRTRASDVALSASSSPRSASRRTARAGGR